MPVYAYACTQCGHAFDARQSFDEPALTTCDQCGGVLRKRYGSVGVTFNGSGFYRTDSRASSGDAKRGSETKPASTSSSTPPSTSTPKAPAASSGGSGATS